MRYSFICSSLLALLPVSLLAQAPAGANVNGPDRTFAIMTAETDLAEIQMGNLALQKSSSQPVKTIAQKLIDDHTKSSTALKQIAQAKGLPLPAETDSKHKAIATKLEGESGEQFDQDFLAANKADHHRVIAAFKKEAKNGKDTEIQGFAKEFLPAIEEHTKMIEEAKGGGM
jgi:putative membrane protein